MLIPAIDIFILNLRELYMELSWLWIVISYISAYSTPPPKTLLNPPINPPLNHTTQWSTSYKASFQMHWDSKILLHLPFKREHPTNMALIHCRRGNFIRGSYGFTIDATQLKLSKCFLKNFVFSPEIFVELLPFFSKHIPIKFMYTHFLLVCT